MMEALSGLMIGAIIAWLISVADRAWSGLWWLQVHKVFVNVGQLKKIAGRNHVAKVVTQERLPGRNI